MNITNTLLIGALISLGIVLVAVLGIIILAIVNQAIMTTVIPILAGIISAFISASLVILTHYFGNVQYVELEKAKNDSQK